MEIVELLALRSFTLRNLSLTGEPLRLFDVALALINSASAFGM